MPTGIYERIKPSGFKGKHHSEQTRRKISEKQRYYIYFMDQDCNSRLNKNREYWTKRMTEYLNVKMLFEFLIKGTI